MRPKFSTAKAWNLPFSLVAALLLTTLLPQMPAYARADDNVRPTEVHTAPKKGPGAMSAWINTRRRDGGDANCSASLVGPRVIVTAAHCLRGDGTTSPVAMDVQVGRHRTSTGKTRYLARCRGGRWWAGTPVDYEYQDDGIPDNGDDMSTIWGSHDIAMVRLTSCKDSRNHDLAKPGNKFGYYLAEAFPYGPSSRDAIWVYFGYPVTSEKKGLLQRLVGATYDPECDADYRETWVYTVCLDGWLIDGGGSGGGLSNNYTGTWSLRGVAHRQHHDDDGNHDGTVFSGFSSSYASAIRYAGAEYKWPAKGDYGIHGSGGRMTQRY